MGREIRGVGDKCSAVEEDLRRLLAGNLYQL
jgi:hypothetical protein